MNNDLISRSELKEAFKAWKTTDDYYHNTDCNDIPLSEAFDLIDNAPTIPLPDFKEGYKQAIIDGKTNFSRPQGEWITGGKDPTGQYFYDEFICNQCFAVETNKSKFCPNCGADMQKGGVNNG